jgi:chemotaxis protein MotB
MRRKRREEEQENHERWLLTYSDLITLLLAFFIMMYTLSKQDAQKYQEVTAHLRAIFTGGEAVFYHPSAQASTSAVSLPSPEAMNAEIMKQLEEEIKSVTPLEIMQNNFKIFVDERGIVVRALDKTFFDEGKADLKDRAKNTIEKIIPTLKKVDREVRIEGHTDNIPINTAEFRSNWELSVRRATEVVRYVIERGDFSPDKISAAGYAEYRPLTDNGSAENRAMNRRIEIIIERPKQAPKVEAAAAKVGLGPMVQPGVVKGP